MLYDDIDALRTLLVRINNRICASKITSPDSWTTYRLVKERNLFNDKIMEMSLEELLPHFKYKDVTTPTFFVEHADTAELFSRGTLSEEFIHSQKERQRCEEPPYAYIYVPTVAVVTAGVRKDDKSYAIVVTDPFGATSAKIPSEFFKPSYIGSAALIDIGYNAKGINKIRRFTKLEQYS